MGMYDIVRVPCPDCGADNEFQSKGGLCTMTTYSLAAAPAAVLGDINRHSPTKCEKCGAQYDVEVIISARSRKVH